MNEDEKYSNLLNWALFNKASQNKIEIRYLSKDNRYVVAAQDIKKDELLINIPEKLFISAYKPELFFYQQKLIDTNDSDLIVLSLYLFQEMNKSDSFFKNFIEYLPNDFSNFPLFYTDEEKRILKYSLLEKKIIHWEEQLNEEHKNVLELFDDIYIKYEEYKKCRHLAWSRDFNIFKDLKSYGTMIPLADMFNYHPSKINVEWFKKDESFNIIADRDISAGEEIILSYGDRNNLEILFNYGFTIEDNPYHVEYKTDETFLLYPNELKDEIKRYRKSNRPTIINKKHEIKALDKLMKYLINKLKNYPTTIEEDKLNLLKYKEESNINKINIYTYLIEEKELILSYLETINIFKKFFDSEFTIDRLLQIKSYNISPLYCDIVEYYIINLNN